MVLDSNIYVAIFCAICGKYERFDISLFSLKRGIDFVIESVCSDSTITVKTYDYKDFYFSVPCTSCNTKHIYKYTLNNTMKNKPVAYKCNLSKMDILLVGDREYINDIVKKSDDDVKDLIDKIGFDEYIENPYIMMKVLDKIHEIAEKDNLFCDCGGKEIDVNLFEDRIELRCMKCNSYNIIYAETNNDLKAIANKNMIILHEKSFTCLDSIYFSGRM